MLFFDPSSREKHGVTGLLSACSGGFSCYLQAPADARCRCKPLRAVREVNKYFLPQEKREVECKCIVPTQFQKYPYTYNCNVIHRYAGKICRQGFAVVRSADAHRRQKGFVTPARDHPNLSNYSESGRTPQWWLAPDVATIHRLYNRIFVVQIPLSGWEPSARSK